MHVAYINVFVGDLTRAVEFYVSVLGLDLQYSSPEHGYACLASGGIWFGLAVPGPDQQDLVGRHTGIGFTVSDLASEHIRLSGLAVNFPMPPTEQPWGGFMALFADPDGNVFISIRSMTIVRDSSDTPLRSSTKSTSNRLQ